MCYSPNTFTFILNATAVLYTCQSILWICLTISAILTFRCVLPTPQYGENSFILTTIVKLWFQGDECMVTDDVPDYPDLHLLQLTEPGDVFSWMVGYLTISIVNIITCILLLKYKAKEQLRFMLGIWCFVALFIAIMDVILTILFTLDYSKIKEHVENSEDKQNITIIPAVMFVISARGFGLWIVNIALIVYFVLWLKNGPNEQKRENRGNRSNSPIHGYDNFTFQTVTNNNVGRQTEPRGKDRGITWEKEAFPQRLSFRSFEAVTPFNEEEYSPGSCSCAGKEENHFPGGYYHSHACPTLMSELEAKLQSVRRETACPREKVKKLVDFSHDVRNFKQGSGRRKYQAPSAPQPPPPAATKCSNSGFY